MRPAKTKMLGVLVLLVLPACAQTPPTVDDLVGCYEVEVGEWLELYPPMPLGQVENIFVIPPHIKLTDVEDPWMANVVEPVWRNRGGNRWWNEEGKVRIMFSAGDAFNTIIEGVWQRGTIQGHVDASVHVEPPGTVAKAEVELRLMPCESAQLLESACDMFNVDVNDCIIRAYYDRCDAIDFCVLRCVATNDGDLLAENGCFESCNDKFSGLFEKPAAIASCSG